MPKEMSSTVRAVKQAVLGQATALQDNAAATGNGTAVQPKASQGSIIVRGTFTATLKIEVSVDGTNYVQLGADVTAAGVVAITGPFPYLRARISAYTSGNIFAHYIE